MMKKRKQLISEHFRVEMPANSPKSDQQFVNIVFRLPNCEEPERDRELDDINSAIEESVENAGVGRLESFDDHVAHRHIWLVGENADELYRVVAAVLKRHEYAGCGYARLFYGVPDDPDTLIADQSWCFGNENDDSDKVAVPPITQGPGC